MPRVVSLRNTQAVKNNPNAGISRSNLSNLPALLAQVPDLLTPQTLQETINLFLAQLKDVTGIDLTGLYADFNTVVANLDAFFLGIEQDILNIPAAIQQFFQQIINWWDSIEAAVITDIQNLFTGSNWDTLYADLGLSQSTITALSTWLNNIPTALQTLNAVSSTTSVAVEDLSTAAAQQALNNKLFHAVDPSLEAVFALTSLTGASPSTISVVEGASTIGFINIGTSATKYTLAWFGGGVTNITAAYVNVYSVSTGTGYLTRVWSSTNVLPYMGSTLNWVYVPITTPIPVTQGQIYAIELQIVGTGTHTLVGLPDHWVTANPNVYPQQLGASRVAMTVPAYDTVGAGAHIGATSPATQTESFTATAGDDVFVFADAYSAAAITAWTVTYGGVSMTQLETVNNDNTAADGQFALFHLAGVSGGAQTISVKATSTGTVYMTFNAVSYKSVGTIGTISTNYGTSSPSVAATGVSGGIVIAGISEVSFGGSATLSSFSGTARSTQSGVGSNLPAVVIGESATVGAVSLTCSSTGNAWAAIAVVLEGVPIAAPSQIAAPTYSQDVPWLALSSETGGTTGVYAPQTTNYPDVGTFQFLLPAWAVYVDLIGIGGGGAGQGELLANEGVGGAAGSWNATVLTVGNTGTDIPAGAIITVTVGSGGSGPTPYFTDGNSGTATTFSWTDASSTPHTLTCAGGAGGSGIGFYYFGHSPGNETHNGVTYVGGAVAGQGDAGNAPGGGGGGAPFFLFGGAGGNGGGWIVARAS